MDFSNESPRTAIVTFEAYREKKTACLAGRIRTADDDHMISQAGLGLRG
jgi:3-methyladenine DNA glycosylase Mpg